MLQELHSYLLERLRVADDLQQKNLTGAIVEYGCCQLVATSLRKNGLHVRHAGPRAGSDSTVDNNFMAMLYTRSARAAFLKANQTFTCEPSLSTDEVNVWKEV